MFKMPCFNLIIELLVATTIAAFFSYFSGTFLLWFVFVLLLLLIWHHYNETHFLKMLDRNRVSDKYQIGIWESISQTLAYQKRRSHKERFKTLRILSRLNKNIQFIPDAVIICGQDGQIYWCNNAAQELFSFFWNKKSQKNLFNVIFYPEFKTYFDNQPHNSPLVLMPNNDQYIEVNLNRYDGENCMLIARDITQIIKLLQSRQVFLSNLNHELRTPLTVLQGYLEMLEDRKASKMLHTRAVAIMQEQVQRMSNLLQQLTLLIKIETSSANEKSEVVDIPAILTLLLNDSEILSDVNHQVALEFEPHLKLKGNPSELNSIFSNLLYNALKHSEGDKIKVSWKRVEQGAYFAVEDNGKGIAPEHIPHLTERFYRVEDSRSRDSGGSGIGLAIVKYALAHLNTQLQISSEPGKGSIFSFTVPEEFVVIEEMAVTNNG
ncbi:phosphate regulon sensor histidine kinase PhoR [Testudinibacter aquarius]|uniref:histidine kinase n=3 Tax=Testudinibacter aquarius TaxID=1524974 RepID=A0A4R3YBI1_9PAST|nr:PAS domain-containing sensor histidine kinase [Testudinibacter aquarius]TCV89132.1 two-component system phosphate regulon sensor histidine kinase PhoR [Testudinibacter aquarius]